MEVEWKIKLNIPNLVEMLILPVTQTKDSELKILKPFPSLFTLYPPTHMHAQYRFEIKQP